MVQFIILTLLVAFIIVIEGLSAKTRKKLHLEMKEASDKMDSDIEKMESLLSLIKEDSRNSYGLSQIENIYRGLILAFNQEQSAIRKAEMQKQIKAIEKLNPKIEF